MTGLDAIARIEPELGLDQAWSTRYSAALMNTFGPPKRVLARGEGAYVWDADGQRYLDLLAGIAVNVLGHAHPVVLRAVTSQLTTLGHVSNFFASAPQVVLAERLLDLLGAPGRVFFCNSGTEANEAAFKIARRTGRPRIIATHNSFHGRTMGALALTGQAGKQDGFTPMPPGVEHIPYGDVDALDKAVDRDVAAVFLEPIQGEGGVIVPPPGYLAAARQITERHGALLVLDEIQTGVGRTGDWFAHSRSGVTPDVVTVAKALGAGIPIGACVGIGAAADLLGPGSHGTTFGGNPIACAAGLAVLHTIERDGLLEQARAVGGYLTDRITASGHPLLRGVRGAGLLLAIALDGPHAARFAAAALELGFIVNNVTPDAVRLAPPLILTEAQADTFVTALPEVLAAVTAAQPAGEEAR
jgi:acetylornithine aminotransferase